MLFMKDHANQTYHLYMFGTLKKRKPPPQLSKASACHLGHKHDPLFHRNHYNKLHSKKLEHFTAWVFWVMVVVLIN